MRKLLLLLLTLPLAFIACSDDKEEVEPNQNYEVYGSWQFTRMDTIIDVKGEDIMKYIEDNLYTGSSPYNSSHQFTFNEDGIFSHSFMKDGEINVEIDIYEAKNGYLYKVENNFRTGTPYYIKNGELHLNQDYTDYLQNSKEIKERFPDAEVKTVILSSVFTKIK